MTTKNKQRANSANKQNKNNKNGKSNRRPRDVRAFSNSIPVSISSGRGDILGPNGFVISSISQDVVRLRGREILGTISGHGTGILGVFDLNPACWSNSRLSKIAMTYEKYRYDMIKVSYSPSVSTSAAGSIAVYLELEPLEDIATTVATALNHAHSALSPIWAPSTLQYRRPTQDPTTYFLTNRPSSVRADHCQGKVIAMSETTNLAAVGFLTVEFDVVFMHPELETGYSGAQYVNATDTVANYVAGNSVTTAGGGPISWPNTNVKVAEMITNTALTGLYSLATGNTYSYAIGELLYFAWSGVQWELYPDLASAVALINPLKWVANGSSFTWNYFVRALSKHT